VVSNKLEETLRCAAEIPEFRSALLNNREEAVAKLDLSDAEKSVLLSVTREQLEKMIDETKKIPAHRHFLLGPVTKLAVGLGLFALAAYTCSPPTRGVNNDIPHEYEAINGLEHIHAAELAYKDSFGLYGNMDSLLKHEKARDIIGTVFQHNHYKFELKTDGKTFTAKAEHQERPKTRPSYCVGPDGKIKKMELAKE